MSTIRPHSSPGSGPLGRALVPGLRICGAGYVLKRLLGRGGFSEVWLARDRKLERDVALKLLPQNLLQDAVLIENLKVETLRARQLVHPAIARVYDFVQDFENVAIVIEYINGWSVAALKVDRPEKRYRADEILPWVRQVCEALEYAHHEVCLVHRDIKPSNLLLDARDHPRLTDFGIAHAIRSALAQRGHLVYGALAYMSPQQVKGAEASVLDDIYSLGATIYDLLTGKPPFYSGDILAQVNELPPPSMTDRLKELRIEDTIAPQWEEVVAACLAKDPAKRPQNAVDVIRGIEATQQVKPIAAATVQKSDVEAPKAVERLEPHPHQAAQPQQAAVSADQTNTTAETASAQAEVSTVLPEDPQPAEALEVSEPPLVAPQKPRWLMPTIALAGVLLLGLVVILVPSRSKSPGAMTGPPGSLDSNFHISPGADHEVRAIAFQPDGKILVGGRFTNFAARGIQGIARLHRDGQPETNFLAGTSGTVHAIAVQSDGKILAGGDFTRINGVIRRRIARLNSDGSIDASFDPKNALNREVRAILIQPDGKILASGSFDGNRNNRIIRFNIDGSRDNTFNTGAGANSAIWALAFHSEGKILAAGEFNRFDNSPKVRLVRLNPDGSIDAGFNTGTTANATIHSVAVQPDGKILLGGNFVTVQGTTMNRIARLSPDGALDPTFKPADLPAGVRNVAIDAAGKIVIGGAFRTVGTLSQSGITRLKPDGSLDSTFDPGVGVNGSVWRVGLDADGKILIGGAFRHFNSVACGNLARLNGDARPASNRSAAR